MDPQLEAIRRALWQTFAVVGGVQVVVAALAAWLGKLSLERILERERAQLAQQNEAAAIGLKADFDRSLSATTVALGTITAGYQAAQERRLAAVAALWSELTRVREATRPGLVFFDILKPAEYDKALAAGSLSRAMVERLRDDADLPEKVLHPIFAVDEHRPFLDDELYALFTVYREILGRAMWLLRQGLESGHVAPWFEDMNLRRIIADAIGEPALKAGTARELKSLTPVLRALEQRILTGCQSTVAGRAATEASLEEAHRLTRLSEETEGSRRDDFARGLRR